ncbi:MAG: RagB/SusD family nutrient uptake outer membrane protein [Chitinophagaceae bacterium]
MKKIFIIILSTGFLMSSCSKKLEILPTQSIDESIVFTSDANIKAALVGAYDGVSAASLFGGDLQLYSELQAADGEIRWAGTFNQPREIYLKDILTNNSYVTATYNRAYYTINICNNILAAIDIVDEDDRDRVKGEALFIRGTVYFELVKLYAKPYSGGNMSTPGLQLITTPTLGNISESNFVPRSSLADTYALILADLTQSKSLLPGQNDVYATTYAASAILSRVYLQMADYPKARDEANTIIESDEFALNSTYAAAFNNTSNSPEDIFAIQVTAQDGSNDMFVFWSTLPNGARDGDVDVLNKHISLYDTADARLGLFFPDGVNIFRSGKWRLQYRNLSIVRLAEMYLTRAECNFRLGTAVGATPDEDINETIRDRAALGPVAITLASILFERKLELAHEGQAIHDVKRLKGNVDGFAFDAKELVFPIPIREINAVGDILEQNEGYN